MRRLVAQARVLLTGFAISRLAVYFGLLTATPGASRFMRLGMKPMRTPDWLITRIA